VVEEFGISRQAASRHVHHFVESGVIGITGMRRCVKYELKELESKRYEFSLKDPLEEDLVWANYVRPLIASHAGPNAYDILNYGFTEIFNNALDHSEGSTVKIETIIYANKIELRINPDNA